MTSRGRPAGSSESRARPILLAVGPLPPPSSGTSVSFQLFCDELRRHDESVSLRVLDSSPRRLKRSSSATSASNYRQAWRIWTGFLRNVRGVDQVLVFGSQGFLALMLPWLLLVAKLSGKPCFARAFGGALDTFYEKAHPLARALLRLSLRFVDGLIVETELLYRFFSPLLGPRVHLAPGYRPVDSHGVRAQRHIEPNTPLRVVFVGLVDEEKGVFVLLESLRIVNRKLNGQIAVHCDVYGAVVPSDEARFYQEVTETPGVEYRGMLDPESVIDTLMEYDALVLPTHYPGEGHPGVIIEAMMAGIAVISTAFRSIPELVDDGVNGLLVNPRDASSLASALERCHSERHGVDMMGSENWKRRVHFGLERNIPKLLQPLGMDLTTPS